MEKNELQRLFLDSCVLADIAENQELFSLAIRFVNDRSYELVIHSLLLMELIGHPQRRQISQFISQVPFVIAETSDRILAIECANYPNPSTLPISFNSTDSGYDAEELSEALETNFEAKIRSFDTGYRKQQESFWRSIRENVENFVSTRPDGKYTDAERWMFLTESVFKMIDDDVRAKLHTETRLGRQIQTNMFKSALLQVSAIFYEYGIQGKSGKSSDVGDFYHLAYVPYCNLSVLDSERNDMINRLSQSGLVSNIKSISNSEFQSICKAVPRRNNPYRRKEADYKHSELIVRGEPDRLES